MLPSHFFLPGSSSVPVHLVAIHCTAIKNAIRHNGSQAARAVAKFSVLCLSTLAYIVVAVAVALRSTLCLSPDYQIFLICSGVQVPISADFCGSETRFRLPSLTLEL